MHAFSRSLNIAILGALISGLTVSCSSAPDKLTKKGSDAATVDTSKRVDVNLGVQAQASGGESLGLTSVASNDFVVNIANCSSGYTATVTSTTATPVSTVSLYNYDTNCTAQLVSYGFKGVTWTKQGGGNLSSGSAIFTDGSGNQMNVTVFQTLASPLVDGGTASFLIQEIVMDSNFVVTNYSFSETLEVQGEEAPNLKVNNVALTAIASGTGIPTFKLDMQCNVPVSGAGNSICQSPSADNQDMTNMWVAIVYDDPTTYAGTLTYSQAQSIITSNGVRVTSGQIGAIGANGGFSVPGIVYNVGPLYTKRDLFIVIQYADPAIAGAKSYRYFTANIGTP